MEHARNLLELATARGLRICTAESCTGGLLAGAITEIPGASRMFECGFVTYSNRAKIRLLGIDEYLLARDGAVSESVAIGMAQGALERAQADLAVSITGIAGPGGSEHKPEGRVCFATAAHDGSVFGETVEFGPRGRSQVRAAAVTHALALLIERLEGMRHSV